MKTRKFLFAMFIAILGLLFYSSCEWEPLVVPKTPPPPDSVSYKTNIQPIFDAKCIKCHKSGFFKVNLEAPDSYDNIFAANLVVKSDAAASKLYTHLHDVGASHNDGRSTDAEQEYIEKWINQGAENN